MSKIDNDAASINAPAAPSAGSVTAPFARDNLVQSQHPALRPTSGNSAGGHVANVNQAILEAAGGPIARR